MRVEDLITNAAIEVVFKNTNFGAVTPREVIAKNLNQVSRGMHIGHTAKVCLSELGLITSTEKYKEYMVTELGKKYLSILENSLKEGSFELSEKQQGLFDFVKAWHDGQLRKYTEEPYHTHLYNVAKIIAAHTSIRNSVEVALCHDLFEDTGCTFPILFEALLSFKYDIDDAILICNCTVELTDVFTKKDFPSMNRAKRKMCEASRLHNISRVSQTVKYADILDNMESIAEHDKRFYLTYLEEKKAILEGMYQGHQLLYKLCKLSV
jgi:hypothetical protein